MSPRGATSAGPACASSTRAWQASCCARSRNSIRARSLRVSLHEPSSQPHSQSLSKRKKQVRREREKKRSGAVARTRAIRLGHHRRFRFMPATRRFDPSSRFLFERRGCVPRYCEAGHQQHTRHIFRTCLPEERLPFTQAGTELGATATLCPFRRRPQILNTVPGLWNDGLRAAVHKPLPVRRGPASQAFQLAVAALRHVQVHFIHPQLLGTAEPPCSGGRPHNGQVKRGKRSRTTCRCWSASSRGRKGRLRSRFGKMQGGASGWCRGMEDDG